MYEPRSRRERTASKKKIAMDEATYIERYLTSWIPHTLTFLSRCVCFFVLQFSSKVLVDANGVPDSCLRWHYGPGPQEEVLSVCERAPRV